jgi:hypothetical protein
MKPGSPGYPPVTTSFGDRGARVSSNERVFTCGTDAVWSVLSDGWLYPLFVVGATRMRDVDASWPAVGARLHHSVGTWPMLLDDDTEVLECTPSTYLRLSARAWPTGEAEVSFTLTPQADGSTKVLLEEDVVSGPATLVPPPLRRPLLQWRNSETLHRLALLAERRDHS